MRPREYEVEDLAAYRGRVDAVTKSACDSFRRDAATVIARHGEPSAWTRADKAEIRDSVAALMSGHIDSHSAATQSLVSRFVEDILEAQGAGTTVDVEERDVSYPARQSARYWYRRLDEGDVDGFVSGCESFVKRSVSHAGDISLLDGATGKKGKARLRYARVPSGPTCPFCLMLASRGFDYLTPESAGELSRFHDDCDCRVVAGYDGLKVKGYDYEGMRRRIGACRETIGTPEEVWRESAALDSAEKSRYGRGVRVSNVELPEELVERIGEQANAFNDYYYRRLMEEMRTRDRAWLYDETEPAIDYSENARSRYGRLLTEHEIFNPADYAPDNIVDRGMEWRDLFAHDALKRAGFRVKTFGADSIDLKIGGEWWKVKSPDGLGARSVETNVRKARRQFDKRGLAHDASIVFNAFYLDMSDDLIEEALRGRMEQHGVGRALLIRKDGSVIRIHVQK